MSGGFSRRSRPPLRQKTREKIRNSVAEIAMAQGSVSTQASAIERSVLHWMPDPFAAIVPATPDDSTWVVETGQTEAVGEADRAGCDEFGRRALPVGEMRLADAFADGDDDALPSDHRAEAPAPAPPRS